MFKEGMEKMEEGVYANQVVTFSPEIPDNAPLNNWSPSSSTANERLLPNSASEVRRKQGQQKDGHDYRARERELEVGDPVLIKDFSSPESKSWQEGIVVQSTGPVSALVEPQDDRNV